MKKMIKTLSVTLGLMASLLFLLTSCDSMNDIQEEYASREEIVYLGKVDSIRTYPGIGRAKITWFVSADPKIQRTVIYWNMRQDSIVKDIVRSESGVHKDSVTLDNLPEGSTLFEFRNVNDRGEYSLYSTASVSVWAPGYGDDLRGRSLQVFEYNDQSSTHRIGISPATEGDNVLHSEIVYTNILGQVRTVEIAREANEVILENFPAGGEFRFRTTFLPPQGIDRVSNSFATYKAPAVVSQTGTMIALRGNSNSRYFDRFGELMYEWNASGALIAYTIATNGELTESASYPNLAPRATYRDFFSYQNDRFVGIRTGNTAVMFQFAGGVLTRVGPENFATGLTHDLFLPTRGFFFARLTNTAVTNGNVQTYAVADDATVALPIGPIRGSVANGHAYTSTDYPVIALFNHQYLLAIDTQGYLYSVPYGVGGVFGARTRIGSGWNRFTKIFTAGTKLYGMQANGDIHVFNNFNAKDNFWVVN